MTEDSQGRPSPGFGAFRTGEPRAFSNGRRALCPHIQLPSDWVVHGDLDTATRNLDRHGRRVQSPRDPHGARRLRPCAGTGRSGTARDVRVRAAAPGPPVRVHGRTPERLTAEQGRVSTRVVSPPRYVLLLPEIICGTPLDLLSAELLDTWSFQTAVADVVLDAMTNGREWNAEFLPLFNTATRSLAGLRPVDLRDPVVLERFMGVQRLLADITNNERTTRYVSGVEHLIAHSLQVRGCCLPHGLQVGLGIALGRVLQSARAALRTELRSCGFVDMPEPVWQRIRAWAAGALWTRRVEMGLLDQALHGALSVRKTHRYTVLDTVSRGELRAALTGLLS